MPCLPTAIAGNIYTTPYCFEYVWQSFWLCFWVAGGVLLLGISCAWLTTRFAFPGSRFLSWALLLPLAFPAYIIAYAYTDLLDFAGPVQNAFA